MREAMPPPPNMPSRRGAYLSTGTPLPLLDGVSGQLHAPVDLPPGKGPLVPTVQEAGWARDSF